MHNKIIIEYWKNIF